MTAHRLAGLLDRGPTLIDRLVGYVIDGAASSAEALLAVEQKVDPAQARRWLAELQQLPPVGAFADNLEYGERYLYLDLMQGSAHKGLAHLMDFFAGPDVHHPFIQWRWIWPLVPMQYSSAMHVGNTWYDRLVEAASKPAGPPRREAMSAVQKDWDVFWSQTRPWHVFTRSDWPIAATTPALFKFIDRADTTQAKRHLAIVALALAAHRGEHGDYPRQLDELKFAALAQIPLDPFTAKPLFYKPARYGYLLYSVGPNLLADQGKGDDVAVRAGASATTNP
jgi:hypothetical protein